MHYTRRSLKRIQVLVLVVVVLVQVLWVEELNVVFVLLRVTSKWPHIDIPVSSKVRLY